jgi:hypothetical protein
LKFILLEGSLGGCRCVYQPDELCIQACQTASESLNLGISPTQNFGIGQGSHFENFGFSMIEGFEVIVAYRQFSSAE